ncbi:MAG: hypothetical protein U0800_09955 [Isosphaeraceae bacterium]
MTIPIGHPCMGGGIAPASRVVDPLMARGFVLLGPDRPIVLVSVDWCEIRNGAYDHWRAELAQAAGTEPARVLVCSVHQHDAPVVDLEAERLLRSHGAEGRICDPQFHARAVSRVVESLKQSLDATRAVTHIGVGKAAVERIASNRRYIRPDGRPAFDRGSATKDAYARDQPEGTIDPDLRSLTFWNDHAPIAELCVYATHPMSYYGKGEISADFVGMARSRRQVEEPGCFQIYATGCSGNITAGKFNDGSPENRPRLADRLHAAMGLARKDAVRHPLREFAFRTTQLVLPPSEEAGFTSDDLRRRLREDRRPFGQCLAALGLSYRRRFEASRPIEVPTIDVGPATIVLLPGESYVEFQLFTQRLRPERFVIAIGYGESGTGYIPTNQALDEEDSNLRDWCWVSRGAESLMKRAIAEVIGANHRAEDRCTGEVEPQDSA